MGCSRGWMDSAVAGSGQRGGGGEAPRPEAGMEIPDPEELEWMESHGPLPEEEENTYFDFPDDGFLPAAGDADQLRNSLQETAASPAKPSAPELIKSMQEQQKQLTHALLDKAKAICAEHGIAVETVVEVGDAKEMICEAAEKSNVDLLILGVTVVDLYKDSGERHEINGS